MPVGGTIERATQECLNGLRRLGYPIVSAYGSSNVELVRSQIASWHLDKGYEEIFWIDSDIVFNTKDFEKIREYDLPIACGIYPKKSTKPDFNTGLIDGTTQITFGEGGGLLEVAWCGTGFLYTKRCVYNDIKEKLNMPTCIAGEGEPFTPYFISQTKPIGEGIHTYLADDRAFSFRARQCGYKIFADTTIRLKHIGKYEYSWEDFSGDRQRFSSMTFSIQMDTKETQ